MNKKSKHGYTGGMNQDSSKSKYPQNNYFEMNNFRIITNEGMSSGNIENEDGMSLSFIIPDLSSMTYNNGDVIPAQTDLKIIGCGNINNTIIVFTTNETSDTPSSYGQIWKLEWDEKNGVIKDITASNELDPTIHLVYNNRLNFSTHYRIGRVIGRYETSSIQRVYWTDNYNSLRAINIADSEAIEIDPENLDIRPSVDFAQPIFKSIGSGDLTVGSVVQYAYRLLDTSGAQTLYSPVSALIPVVENNPYTTTSYEFEGDVAGENSPRSVTYTISGLDTDYQVIEHVVILYQYKNIPKIYKFKEDTMPSDGDLEVTHYGNEEYEEIDLVLFNELSSGFNVCKDIEVKNNRLIAANITNENFDVDFDTRVYRYNNLGEALIKDSDLGDITLLASSPSYSSVPENHDCINPYNNENDTNWPTLYQYKFKDDGVTIGGSGLNISYQIVEHLMFGDNAVVNTTVDHINVGRWPSTATGNSDLGLINPDGSTVFIPTANQLYNNASPSYSAYFRGYARGEVYRFGIVFYSKKGSASFVKWIGDIRMPEPVDGFPVGTNDGVQSELRNLGIEFTLDLSSIADQISGFRIVRVERSESDITRLGTGTIMLFERQNAGNGTTLIERWQNGNTIPLTQFTNDTDIDGSTNTNVYHINDKPGINSEASKEGFVFINPISQFGNYVVNSGDFLKTTGYYSAHAYAYRADSTNDVYAFHYKLRNFLNSDHGSEYLEIEAGRKVNHGEVIDANSDILTAIGDVNAFINASYSRAGGGDANIPLAVGNSKFVGVLSNSPTTTHCVAYPSMDWYGSGDYSGMAFTGDEGSTVYFKEVALCRYVANQYGGNTYEARSVNRYISTGHFQCVNSNTGNSFTQQVFGGDIFVNYYDSEILKFYSDQTEAFGERYPDVATNRLSVAVICPCESGYNTELSIGTRWANYRDGGDAASFDAVIPINDNSVFYQQNNVEDKFFAKDYLSRFVTEQPNKIWASEQKINGELIDNWRIFRPNTYIEVDGNYGPINRIINFKNTIYYFQDAAFGVVSINERSMITDESGVQLVVGNGGVLDYFQNISINTGSIHQFGVVANDQGIYWFDARLKKLFRYSNQGNQPLSDLKGMSSYFAKNISGEFTISDRTITELNDGPIGVHATVDYRYNRVLFTFLNNKPVKELTNNTNVTITFYIGDIVTSGSNTYEVVTSFTLDPGERLSPGSDDNFVLLDSDYINGFTISFNEMTNSFESFYSFKPSIYYNYGRRLLSVDPYNKDRVYEHNKGVKCVYYDRTAEDSDITLLLNPNADLTKIFNNIEFFSEVTLNGADIYNESLSSYQCFNEYQDTGEITFTVNSNIRRTMREWRFTIGRDEADGKSRIRNPYTFLKLKYTNTSNHRLVLHDIILSYTISSF